MVGLGSFSFLRALARFGAQGVNSLSGGTTWTTFFFMVSRYLPFSRRVHTRVFYVEIPVLTRRRSSFPGHTNAFYLLLRRC